MKLKSEKIIYPVQSSFKILKYTVPRFEMPFHYHSEYELVYITKGSGQRFIGNSIHRFKNGDMVFLGADLAHVWVNEKKYDEVSSELEVEAIVLQFSKELFSSLIETPEFSMIKDLFSKAKVGLKVGGETRVKIADCLNDMLQCEGVDRLLSLIRVLKLLAQDKRLAALNPLDFSPGSYHRDKRINTVYHYVISRYHQKLSVQDAAVLAHMEKSAFCRFFKAKTQMTFTRFVNETRIDHACRLLLENRQSVSQIAFEVGFNNLSNFYRQFKKITNKTPNAYMQDSGF